MRIITALSLCFSVLCLGLLFQTRQELAYTHSLIATQAKTDLTLLKLVGELNEKK